MLGKAICGAAIAAADRRELATEWAGARPGGVRSSESAADERTRPVPAEPRRALIEGEL